VEAVDVAEAEADAGVRVSSGQSLRGRAMVQRLRLLRQLGRWLTPFRECGSAALFEDVVGVEVTVEVEVVVD